MRNILVPTDGSKPALRALELAISIAKQQIEPCTIHVVNVQSPIISNNVSRFFSAEVLTGYYDDEGKAILDTLVPTLSASGVQHQTHVAVGTIDDVIKRFITEHQCDHLIMGTRGLSPVPGLLLGSAATKIIHAVDIPVTLVK